MGRASESADAPVPLRCGDAPCVHGTMWRDVTADKAFANSILKASATSTKPSTQRVPGGLDMDNINLTNTHFDMLQLHPNLAMISWYVHASSLIACSTNCN